MKTPTLSSMESSKGIKAYNGFNKLSLADGNLEKANKRI